MNTKNNNSTTILVVDDEIEIRSMVVDYLRDISDYTVMDAKDGTEALELLKTNHADLILSDINMPGMRGFELLHVIREKYPDMKRVLMTAYNVEEYLDMALKYDIGNIFVKTAPFNFNELTSILRALLTNNIFGIDHFFTTNVQTRKTRITSSENLEQHAAEFVSFLNDSPDSKKLELVLVELLTNAIFYGIRHESPENKELWNHNFILSDNEAVVVTLAKDDDKFAISINDNGGKLKKKDVLYWLHRQISQDDEGLPLGLYDSHGRGLFITRKYIDRLIINIDQSHRTEIIIINYYNNDYLGYKPLYINEL